MEEFDELCPTPNEEGALELQYRAWETIDSVVWTMGKELLKLNISFNRVEYLPPELGDLQLLLELNCSCNKLDTLPAQIGKLKQLTHLKCNGNAITHLPNELGNCSALEEVYASENRLTRFPVSVGQLQNLRILRLQDNQLHSIPSELADIETLQDVNCDLNPPLYEMVPLSLQSSHTFIMWVCRHHRKHALEVLKISGMNDELSVVTERAKLIERKLTAKLQQANEERSELANSAPTKKSAACTIS